MDSEKARALGFAGKAAVVSNLERAAVDVAGAETFEEVLHAFALQARLLVPSHQAAASYIPGGEFAGAIHTHSFSPKYAKWNEYDVMPTGEGIWGCLASVRRPMRLTEEELYRHPRFNHFSGLKDARGLEHPPMPGWLAVPLLSKDGEMLGVI